MVVATIPQFVVEITASNVFALFQDVRIKG